ncbi:hypothetical protein DVH24_029528 [Malus domestica]|uniref:Uncharacterized protein n=1 Tax=Malus domestica TaxID=3750 RepID=A0A498HYX8_MALDO|nr:hypothetical protein DVH24_029528 [Malus domestica]
MEALSCAILTLALVAALSLLSKGFFPQPQKLKLPPGPKPWPVIGNLNLIGPLPHQSLHKLSQTYGPIMKLMFGSYPVVIASSAEMARQFLKTHDHIFASRPETAAGKYTTYNYKNLTWAPHGPYWRQGRKIYLSHLFSSKVLDSVEYIRVEENRAFLSRLCAVSGKPTMLKEHLSRLTLSNISRIVLGKKYFSVSESETSIVSLEEFQEMLDELFLLNGFHDHVLDEHKANMKEVKDFVSKDMVDLLMQLAEDPGIEVKLNYDSVKGFTQVRMRYLFTNFCSPNPHVL